jgi:hypothetical protein
MPCTPVNGSYKIGVKVKPKNQTGNQYPAGHCKLNEKLTCPRGAGGVLVSPQVCLNLIKLLEEKKP